MQKLWSEPKYLLTRTASGVIWTGYLQSPVNLCNNTYCTWRSLSDFEIDSLRQAGRGPAQLGSRRRRWCCPGPSCHPDRNDFVVVINADKVQLTGNKADTKTYYRHSGYNGGLKAESFRQAMEKHPEKVIERAVRGMLPKTTLGRAQMTKLKVYAGAEHPHAAQNPTKIELEA